MRKRVSIQDGCQGTPDAKGTLQRPPGWLHRGGSAVGHEASGERGPDADPGGRLAILMVVEDRRLCDSLAALLRVVEYKVVNVYSGAEALTEVKNGRFDAAVIDVKLPDVEGVEVLEALREADPHVGALMLSEADTLERAVESLRRGADSFLLMPSDPDDLLVRLGKVARLKRLQRGLEESEARYGELLKDIEVGAYQSDLEGNFTAMNPSGAEILGFEGPGDILDGRLKVWETYFSRDEHEALQKKVLREGEVRRALRRYRRRDGTLGWLETTIKARKGEGGAIIGFEGVFRDVTDRFWYREVLEALHGLFADLGEVKTVEEVGGLTLEFLRWALDIEAGGFATVNDGVVRHIERDTGDGELFEMPFDVRSVASRAVITGETQAVTDARENRDRASAPFDWGEEIWSVLVIPVKLGGEVIALIEAGSTRPEAFSDEDIKLVEIVGVQVASTLYRLVRSKLEAGRGVKLGDFM